MVQRYCFDLSAEMFSVAVPWLPFVFPFDVVCFCVSIKGLQLKTFLWAEHNLVGYDHSKVQGNYAIIRYRL